MIATMERKWHSCARQHGPDALGNLPYVVKSDQTPQCRVLSFVLWISNNFGGFATKYARRGTPERMEILKERLRFLLEQCLRSDKEERAM